MMASYYEKLVTFLIKTIHEKYQPNNHGLFIILYAPFWFNKVGKEGIVEIYKINVAQSNVCFSTLFILHLLTR